MEFHLNFPNKKISGSGICETLEVRNTTSWNLVDNFLKKNKGRFIFCFLSYDLKSILHGLPSQNPKLSNFPLALFIVPDKISQKRTESQNNSQIIEEFNFPDRDDYLQNLDQIKNHLKKGDIYETNFCIAPQIQAKINPKKTFDNIVQLNQAPFTVFLNFKGQNLLCSSPERFIKKQGNKLISQPIKGTIKRGQNALEDNKLKFQLTSDPKETAENIMIVDLVRNDLSQIAKRNSVSVEKLNEIQTFKTVHQLVSTISCELRDEVSFSEIIQATFPMGSMTGAPKKRAMELMENYENFSRGIYSGSVGYIDEEGNFDFNVVIRSIIYDENDELTSFPVGSAITYKSIPEKEYEECMLKAKSMIKSLVYAD